MIQIAIFLIWPYYLKTIISLIKQEKKNMSEKVCQKKRCHVMETPKIWE